MRKFIVSDIHGFGNFYYTVMNYLDNISEHEEIELYINGDLIDRGLESAEILLDLIRRIKENKFKIEYLGGNHELMMYQVFDERRKGFYVSDYNDWYLNGGQITDDGLVQLLNDKDKILEVADFISNLKIYHKFDEELRGKPIVLVHAACPLHVKKNCNITIKKDNDEVFNAVWTREFDPFLPFKCKVGNDKFFTIIGHTPVIYPFGYDYNSNGNYLNIDGGAAYYVKRFSEYNHFPLVEVCDNCLKILTFNNNGEIIYGNYFNGINSVLYTEDELEKEKKIITKKISLS